MNSSLNVQESETSKLYAERKEEEVKILEHSVEELESTINVLEKKVSIFWTSVSRKKKKKEANMSRTSCN